MKRPAPSLKRLTLVAPAIEASLYTASAPLLPHYSEKLELTQTEAGVLFATYAAGMIAGSVAGAVFADRPGPRLTLLGGLGLLAAASLGFGLADSIALLDTARLLQGLGAGLVWSALLAWLIADEPAAGRGDAIGSAVGSSLLGSLLGPILGTLAAAIGPAPVFGAVGLVATSVACWAARIPGPRRSPAGNTAPPLSAFTDRRLLATFGLALLPWLMMGMLGTLVPLRLNAAGAPTATIGIAFFLSALIAGLLSPRVGRLTDRGRTLPLLTAGLLASAASLAALAYADATWAITMLTVIALCVGLCLVGTPGFVLVSHSGEAAGLAPGPTAALINLAFAGGEMLGAVLSPMAARAFSPVAPYLVLCGLQMTVAAALLISPPRFAAPALPPTVPMPEE